MASHIQIRASDTNVDDSLNLLASVTLPLATSHLLREFLHVLEDGVDFLNDALAIDLHGLVGNIAQGDVVDGTVFREIDGLSLEHVIAKLLQVGLLGELHEKGECLIGDEVLGEVEQDLLVIRRILEGPAELLEALRVLLEIFLQDNILAQSVVVLLESFPGAQFSSLRETRHCGSSDGIRYSYRGGCCVSAGHRCIAPSVILTDTF